MAVSLEQQVSPLLDEKAKLEASRQAALREVSVRLHGNLDPNAVNGALARVASGNAMSRLATDPTEAKRIRKVDDLGAVTDETSVTYRATDAARAEASIAENQRGEIQMGISTIDARISDIDAQIEKAKNIAIEVSAREAVDRLLDLNRGYTDEASTIINVILNSIGSNSSKLDVVSLARRQVEQNNDVQDARRLYTARRIEDGTLRELSGLSRDQMIGELLRLKRITGEEAAAMRMEGKFNTMLANDLNTEMADVLKTGKIKQLLKGGLVVLQIGGGISALLGIPGGALMAGGALMPTLVATIMRANGNPEGLKSLYKFNYRGERLAKAEKIQQIRASIDRAKAGSGGDALTRRVLQITAASANRGDVRTVARDHSSTLSRMQALNKDFLTTSLGLAA